MAYEYGYSGNYMPQNYSNFQPKPNYSYPPQPQASPWLYVPAVKDVQSVQVQPGQKAWIMVQNDCVFALRSADNMGIVSTDFYRFEKINEDAAMPASEYITRKEFEDFVNSLKGGAANE